METLKVKRSGQFYLLFNLTVKEVRDLQDNPQQLSQYLNNCLDTGTNICLFENDCYNVPTTTDRIPDSNLPSTSTSVQTTFMNVSDASGKEHTFDFLCQSIDNYNYIWAIKFGQHPWHYFQENDCTSDQHGSLLALFNNSISQMTSIGTITVSLDQTTVRQYFNNGKFVFKNKELKTHSAIVEEQTGNKTTKSSDKSTKRLVFISGQTNPLLFLNEFEKCSDIKNDKDKMYQILNFVDECHKNVFTDLYFESDWQSVKSKFLQSYTNPFIENKKRDLNIEFNEQNTLRYFVHHKLASLDKYTTMPFLNQVEIVMNELPVEISRLFILHEKMTSKKEEILNYCDSIQDLVENFHEKSKDPPNETHRKYGEPSTRMEVDYFHFTSEEDSISPKPSRGRKRGRGAASSGGVTSSRITRGGSKLKTIKEAKEGSDGLSFLLEIDNSSRSSWSN